MISVSALITSRIACRPVSRLRLRLAAGLLVLAFLSALPLSVAGAERQGVIVVDDKAFPPFAFLDADGNARGITVDIWKLWSRKTGIPVAFKLMAWDAALAEVEQGRADVVGGLFRTAEREKILDFTTQILKISTGIFFHNRVAGIKGVSDLRGFQVGVVKGDGAEELLRSKAAGITIVAYPGADELVRDAVDGKIHVFMADIPIARFYLAQHPQGGSFRLSEDILVNQQFAAVRKGNARLLATIQAGLDRIEPSEIEAIVTQWSGRPALKHFSWQAVLTTLVAAISLLVAAFLWNLFLHRRVEEATRDINEKNRQLNDANEALRVSENKFRVIFENAPYSIVISRLSGGRFIAANNIFLERNNLKKEEVSKLRVNNVIKMPGKDRRLIVDALRRQGVVKDVFTTVKKRDGSETHIIFSAVLLPIDEQDQVLSIVVDVSDKIKFKEDLKKSEEKFRTIFHNAPIGIFRTTFDGRIIEANATLARMLGYANRNELLESIKDLATDIYPEPGARQALLDALVRSPQGIRREIDFKRKDGLPLYAIVNVSLQMDADGRPAFLNGTIEDITSLKQTESELRNLAAAVEQSGEVIAITDPYGVIAYVNQAFEEITGYARLEALGQNMSLLKSGEHERSFYRDFWQTISSGKTWSGRFTNLRKDGSRYIEDATVSPVFDKHGKIVNYVAAKRDITQEVNLEEQYRQMQKMETIGRLIGGVAHDFNNLLQAMNGYTDLAMTDLDAASDSREFLSKARGVGQRAANLVQQLLLFSRRQTLKPKLLKLENVVTDMLKMIDRLIGEHIRIEWIPRKEPCIISGDSGMLDQVLMNLCVNARDAMPDGGVLTIETRNVFIDDDFCASHAWARPGWFALLSVRDTGCGMDQKTLKRIFEPFFTTKEEGKGTGLGLATIYGIVQQHDGMINAYSELGKGTVFNIYLPLHEQAETADNIRRREAPRGGEETILLAEDDETVRELARTILERAGYRVLVAEDGEEAVRLYDRNAGRIALLLLDVVMPKMGGYAAYMHIHKCDPDIAVVFASGYGDTVNHTNFALADGLPLIEKPYSNASLLKAIRKALDAKAPSAAEKSAIDGLIK